MKYLIMMVMINIYTFAAPAIPQELIFTQADGSQFKGKLIGDEYFHWQEDKAGRVLIYDKDSKNYDYAVLKQVDSTYQLVSSGYKYNTQNKGARSVSIGNVDKKILYDIWREKRKKRND